MGIVKCVVKYLKSQFWFGGDLKLIYMINFYKIGVQFEIALKGRKLLIDERELGEGRLEIYLEKAMCGLRNNMSAILNCRYLSVFEDFCILYHEIADPQMNLSSGHHKKSPTYSFSGGRLSLVALLFLVFLRGKKQRQMLQLRSGSLPEAVALVWLSEGACLSSFVFPSPFPLPWPGKAVYLIPSQCLSLLPCCSLEKEWAHHRNLLLFVPSLWLTFFPPFILTTIPDTLSSNNHSPQPPLVMIPVFTAKDHSRCCCFPFSRSGHFSWRRLPGSSFEGTRMQNRAQLLWPRLTSSSLPSTCTTLVGGCCGLQHGLEDFQPPISASHGGRFLTLLKSHLKNNLMLIHFTFLQKFIVPVRCELRWSRNWGIWDLFMLRLLCRWCDWRSLDSDLPDYFFLKVVKDVYFCYVLVWVCVVLF